MVGAQQDKGKALVIAQQHVERRTEPLDQLRFQQQRLGLGIGGDDLHAAGLADHPLQPPGQPGDVGVIRHPRLQAAGLADIEHLAARIEHAVDAGDGLEHFHHIADRRHPAFQIGLRAGDGIGGALLVETLRTAWVVRGACGGSGHGCQIGTQGHDWQFLRGPLSASLWNNMM